jgi:hypothetical protein
MLIPLAVSLPLCWFSKQLSGSATSRTTLINIGFDSCDDWRRLVLPNEAFSAGKHRELKPKSAVPNLIQIQNDGS